MLSNKSSVSLMMIFYSYFRNSLKTNGKDSDYQRIFAKFTSTFMIVYEDSPFHQGNSGIGDAVCNT